MCEEVRPKRRGGMFRNPKPLATALVNVINNVKGSNEHQYSFEYIDEETNKRRAVHVSITVSEGYDFGIRFLNQTPIPYFILKEVLNIAREQASAHLRLAMHEKYTGKESMPVE